MYLYSYIYQPDKDKCPSFICEVYHNRAEVSGPEIERTTYHYYDDVGEILADYPQLNITVDGLTLI